MKLPKDFIARIVKTKVLILSRVSIALRHGADINASNLAGNTPVHFCYKYRNVELGQYIISKGADKILRNLDGQTCEDLLNMTF